MNETEARAWIADRWGSPAVDRLTRYAEMIVAGSVSQNLVAPSTLDAVWARHLVDSAQLVPLAEPHAAKGAWIDIGSGAGLPGIVAAILQPRPVILVEPRRRRAEFLIEVIEALALDAKVEPRRIETVRDIEAAVISARAVASLDGVFFLGRHLATTRTLWLLPKGRTAQQEVDNAALAWHGMFHVEHSVTAADSLIVVARGVEPR